MNSDISRIVLVILALFALIFFLNMYSNKKDSVNTERFFNANSEYVDDSEYNQDQLDMNNYTQDYSTDMEANNIVVPNTVSTNSVDDVSYTDLNASYDGVYPSEIMGQNEVFKPIFAEDLSPNQLPSNCYPKDKLTADDLLPKDANSRWAQVNPAGQGDVRDQNFLNAGFLLGINTVGQSLKNANLQLRSEPPNPQQKVSPWNQSTIDPDLNRKPLEIGGCQ